MHRLPFLVVHGDDRRCAIDPEGGGRGDGGPLADLIERSDERWSTAPGVLLALVPGVTRDRERLAAALHALDGPGTSTVFGSCGPSRCGATSPGSPATRQRLATRRSSIATGRCSRIADKLIAFLLLDQVWGWRSGPELDGWFP